MNLETEEARAQRLSEIVATYLQACAEGQAPADAEFLARHPDLAEELRDFLADHRKLNDLAGAILLPQARPAPSAPTLPQVAAPGPGSLLRYLGDYELVAEIARGGMGVVYRARQLTLNRTVAVKMILSGRLASADDVQRFHMEVETAGNLDHPNIVPIYEVNEAGGQHYFSMKLIDGGSLRQALDDPGWQATLSQRVALIAGVARGVHHAHQRGIIHRDLKPANILLDRQGQAHVTDFGLARHCHKDQKLTQSGAIVGTPAYMAPEQADGTRAAVTTLADVYSLGAILYELLTGQAPFRGETLLQTLDMVRTSTPVPPRKLRPEIDRDLEAICLRCLAKEPGQRYPSAEALADDLERWRRGEPISLSQPSLAAQVWHWLRQNVRTAVWLAAIGLFCTLVPMLLVMRVSLPVLFDNAAKTFDKMPSVPRPWLLTVDWWWLFPQPPPAFEAVVWIGATGLAMAIFGVMGLWTVRVARPRDVWSDLNAGLGVGMVSALTAFFAGMIQAVVLALVVVPQIEDLSLVTAGCFQGRAPAAPDRPPAEQLLARYPDLEKMPVDERGNIIMGLMVSRMCVGTFEAVAYTALGCLLFGLSNGLFQTLTAGYLSRRDGLSWRIVPTYVELTATCAFLVGAVSGNVFNLGMFHHISLVPALLLAVVAWTGVMRRCRFLLRLALYGAIYWGSLALEQSDFLANLRPHNVIFLGVALVCGVCALVLLADGGRRRHPAGTTDADIDPRAGA